MAAHPHLAVASQLLLLRQHQMLIAQHLLVEWVQVLDDHLKTHEWLAADQYTIADIANFSWVRPRCQWQTLDIFSRLS